MDFAYSEEDEQFRETVRSWLQENAPEDLSRGKEEDLAVEFRWERQKAWHKKLYEGRWIGLWWPKEYGGRGASVSEQAVFNEELTRASVPSGVNMSGVTMLGPTLMHWGTEEQKRRFLPRILPAEEIWCQGYSEPDSGSDLASLRTRADEEGDHFVVNGEKVWTSWAQHSDWCFLLVRTDPDAPKHNGISYLLVDMKSPGITVRPLVQMNGDSEFNEVFFDNVCVPKENLVGGKNRGWMVAITTLMFERVATSSYFRVETILPQLYDLARTIERDGNAAVKSSAVRQQLAQFAIEAAAIRYNELRRLTRQIKGQPPGPEGSFAKIASTELNLRVAEFAMELLGPYALLSRGSILGQDRGRWSYRALSARAGTIAAGTNEILRGVIGERVLGLPKSR